MRPASSTAKRWIVRTKPSPRARVRLFCFPCGGVGASPYKQWPEALGPLFDVCALHPPGREARRSEATITEIARYMDEVMEAVRPLLDKPFALFGHSVGALVVFELARRLRREGAPMPLHLFVSGRHAPQWVMAEKAHSLPDAAFVDLLRTLNGLPAAALESRELMEVMLPLLRDDCALHESYVYASEAPLAVPISVFAGVDDPTAVEEQLEAWGEQTTGRFLLRRMAGDHFYLNAHREALLAAIREDLGEVLGGSWRPASAPGRVR
jgi:medium-chain acyl-[acyl-carrier-protein] hydrolase